MGRALGRAYVADSRAGQLDENAEDLYILLHDSHDGILPNPNLEKVDYLPIKYQRKFKISTDLVQ